MASRHNIAQNMVARRLSEDRGMPQILVAHASRRQFRRWGGHWKWSNAEDSLPRVSHPASESEPRAWHGRRTLIVLLAVALALRLGWALSRPVDEATIRALP